MISAKEKCRMILTGYSKTFLKSELKKSCENAPKKQVIEISSRISFFISFFLIEANISQSHFQKVVLTEF